MQCKLLRSGLIGAQPPITQQACLVLKASMLYLTTQAYALQSLYSEGKKANRINLIPAMLQQRKQREEVERHSQLCMSAVGCLQSLGPIQYQITILSTSVFCKFKYRNLTIEKPTEMLKRRLEWYPGRCNVSK